ncbi:hypothetical protein ACFPM0_04695 [Pseudonocardia sulfidoxydans]|uniref:hypothetical protein n=1 Tax=Pseudonocardia sulfidoxydans TaxID=54011 RepID=UPI00360DEF7E
MRPSASPSDPLAVTMLLRLGRHVEPSGIPVGGRLPDTGWTIPAAGRRGRRRGRRRARKCASPRTREPPGATSLLFRAANTTVWLRAVLWRATTRLRRAARTTPRLRAVLDREGQWPQPP